jgi:hypothetical protein
VRSEALLTSHQVRWTLLPQVVWAKGLEVDTEKGVERGQAFDGCLVDIMIGHSRAAAQGAACYTSHDNLEGGGGILDNHLEAAHALEGEDILKVDNHLEAAHAGWSDHHTHADRVPKEVAEDESGSDGSHMMAARNSCSLRWVAVGAYMVYSSSLEARDADGLVLVIPWMGWPNANILSPPKELKGCRGQHWAVSVSHHWEARFLSWSGRRHPSQGHEVCHGRHRGVSRHWEVKLLGWQYWLQRLGFYGWCPRWEPPLAGPCAGPEWLCWRRRRGLGHHQEV